MMAKKELKTKSPVFIISIDIGILSGEGGEQGEKSIETLLELFETYKIPVTWAIVGCLFIEYPSTMERIMEKILRSTVKHEIGWHSFSHINFSERGKYCANFEIKQGLELANKFGIALKSFVFPDNAMGHIDVLRENGFIIYRGQDIKREKLNQMLFSRIVNMGIDRLISQPVEPKQNNGIWEIPASMHFSEHFFSWTLLPRAKMGIHKAICSDKVFHIWLHPQDFLADTSLIIKFEKLLTFVAEKRDKQKIQILTMGELGSMLRLNENYRW